MLTPVIIAAEPIKLFVTIDRDIQRQLDALVIPAVNNLIGALQTTALLGGTLYILIVGLTIVLGADSTPFYTFLKTAGKIAFVAALSLSSEGYLGGVMGALRGLESGLLQVFGLFPNSSGPDGGLPFQLDRMMSIGFDKLAECFARADSYGALSPGAALAWVAAGLIFAFSTAVLAIFGGAITILVQFALAILFALGPLFVLCLMFPQTSGFFDKWLGEVLSFLLQNVVVAIVLSFALNIFLTFMKRAELGKDGPSPWTAAMQIFVVALVMVYFLWKSGPMVAGLSGGMGSSIIDAVSAYQTGKGASKGAVAGAKAAGGTVAGAAKRAAAVAKGVGSGASKTMRYLSHFGKSQDNANRGSKASSMLNAGGKSISGDTKAPTNTDNAKSLSANRRAFFAAGTEPSSSKKVSAEGKLAQKLSAKQGNQNLRPAAPVKTSAIAPKQLSKWTTPRDSNSQKGEKSAAPNDKTLKKETP